MWEGKATEEHRKESRILSTLSGTERNGVNRIKSQERYVKYGVIGVRVCDSSGGCNQGTRKPHVAEDRLFVDGEMLGVAQARVSDFRIRQAGASYNCRASWTSARFYSLR